MTEFDIGHIIRQGVFALRGCHHLVSRNEQQFSIGINETLDEPGTGDTIDLRLLG